MHAATSKQWERIYFRKNMIRLEARPRLLYLTMLPDILRILDFNILAKACMASSSFTISPIEDRSIIWIGGFRLLSSTVHSRRLEFWLEISRIYKGADRWQSRREKTWPTLLVWSSWRPLQKMQLMLRKFSLKYAIKLSRRALCR